MCMFGGGGKSSAPVYVPQQTQQEPVASPTLADAEVTKASAIERKKAASLAGRNIKTSARGLNDEAQTNKKNLLGE